jgi:hypothetical protein
MIKRIIYIILILLLLIDLGYSFAQHLGQPLDGDMAWNIVPSNDVKPILDSPFGTAVFFSETTYPNPNRFFCHWIFKEYFETIPLLLQKFVQPIDSIYLSCAIAKILIQIFLIFLLSVAITGNSNLFKLDFVIIAFLIAPLFQINGYRSYMGIIDPSITYTFFYALPCAIILLYFLPFILNHYHHKNKSFQLLIKILWIPLAIVVCLSGPLNPGIALIVSMLLVFQYLEKETIQLNQKGSLKKGIRSVINIPKSYLFYLMPICILSLYSLFIGRYNLNNIEVPVSEKFLKLPLGVYYQFTQKLGFPILFLILALNSIIIHKNYRTEEGKKILNLFKWFGLFALIYIILLPFGGYRDYRPNFLRYDTIMPITLGLFFVFGSTTLFIIKKMTNRQKIWYIPLIVLILFIYTNSDEPQFDNNECERAALKEISMSTDSIVQLDYDCTVLSWRKIEKPKDSELNAELLNVWNITKEKRLYFNK